MPNCGRGRPTYYENPVISSFADLHARAAVPELRARRRPGSPVRSRRRGLPRHPHQLHPKRDRRDRRGVLVHGGRALHHRADQEAPGRRAGAGADGSAGQCRLSAECDAPERAADRRHPDAEAADQLHPPLEDDAVPRPERRRVQRRELQRQRVASGDRDPLRELHGRGDLLHQRHARSSTASGPSSTTTG